MPARLALLSQGFVEDGKVECPLHEAVFDDQNRPVSARPRRTQPQPIPGSGLENQIQITFVEETVA